MLLETVENLLIYEENSSDFNRTGLTYDKLYEEFWSQRRLAMTLCVLYALLLSVGLAGNLKVISVVVYILRTFRGTRKRLNTVLYVLALSCVDTLVLLNIPVLLCDIYYGHWAFGLTLCKLNLITETVNKILSKFVLVAMSFDRYIAMCHPRCRVLRRLRTSKGTLCVLTCILSSILVIAAPVYSNIEEIIFEDIAEDGQTVVVTQCAISHQDETSMSSYVFFVFVTGFCLPTLLIAFFYSRILAKIYRHVRFTNSLITQIPVRKVTCVTLALIFIYLLCWTPYWGVTLSLAVNVRTAEPTVGEVYLMHIVHLMVYLNSAINWIMYAYLNVHWREMRNLASFKTKNEKSRLLSTTDKKIGIANR